MNIKEKVKQRDKFVKILETLKDVLCNNEECAEYNREGSIERGDVNFQDYYQGKKDGYEEVIDLIDTEIKLHKITNTEQLIEFLKVQGCYKKKIKTNYVFELKADDDGNMIKIVLPEEDDREKTLAAINLMAVVYKDTIENIISDVGSY